MFLSLAAGVRAKSIKVIEGGYEYNGSIERRKGDYYKAYKLLK